MLQNPVGLALGPGMGVSQAPWASCLVYHDDHLCARVLGPYHAGYGALIGVYGIGVGSESANGRGDGDDGNANARVDCDDVVRRYARQRDVNGAKMDPGMALSLNTLRWSSLQKVDLSIGLKQNSTLMELALISYQLAGRPTVSSANNLPR